MNDLSPFIYTLIWNTLVSIWIITTILIAKIFKNTLNKYLEYFTATTVWLLLWIIFLGFIPKLTLKWNLIWDKLWIFILLWIFLFYLLELFLHWHHCKDLENKDKNKHSHSHENSLLIFWWTLLHNIFHWIVLFSAFAVNLNFWMATTLAVLLHSIPQNIVNYIMNHNKIIYAYIAALWWILWALLTYPFKSFLVENKFYFLALITWWLLYTALADIFPEIKWKWTIKQKISYLIFIIIWLILFLWFEKISS